MMTRKIVMTAMTIAAILAGLQTAAAQSSGSSGETMKSLLEQGYEIKAAAPNGNKYVVFMQKDKAAYACEFVTVTNSRCGAINSEAN